MGKIVSFLLVVVAALASVYIGLSYYSFESEAATDTLSLSINVQEYLNLNIDSGASIDFGTLNPGTPECPATSTVVSVTTNAANGYTLGLHDGVAGSDSALAKGAVYIPDYAGTIGSPTTWTGNGLGVTMFAADSNKEASWGTGTTACDASNAYAGIPETATTAHTVTGYKETADTSSWGWKVDAPNTQETGAYSGTVTVTATAVVS